MPDPPEPDYDAREVRRAEARARTQRNRRVAAVGALTAVAAAVFAFVALGGGDDEPSKPAENAAATSTAKPTPAKQNAAAVPARAPEPAPGASAPPGKPIPILMYHVVEAPPAGTPYPDLWVAPERFRAEMAMLNDKGFTAITMRDAYDYWKGRRRVPKNPIVLTFDDGYRSHVSVVAPVLRKLDWPGVLYLTATAFKGRGAEGMSKAEVRDLLGFGWELGSHTIDHADVTTLAPDRLRYETAYSKRYFERMFKVKIGSFCYPAGKFNDAAVAAVKAAGYDTATTVEEGLGTPPDFLRLKRVRVNGSDTAATLQEKLAGLGALP